MTRLLMCVALLALLMVPALLLAAEEEQEEPTLADAVTKGTLFLDLRYRFDAPVKEPRMQHLPPLAHPRRCLGHLVPRICCRFLTPRRRAASAPSHLLRAAPKAVPSTLCSWSLLVAAASFGALEPRRRPVDLVGLLVVMEGSTRHPSA